MGSSFRNASKGSFIYIIPQRGKEGNVLFNDVLNTFLFMVMWRHTYGKGPFRERERKEGNILFNDAINTFYLRLYGIRHMVKDHSYIVLLNNVLL